jgi:hypothetical protein
VRRLSILRITVSCKHLCEDRCENWRIEGRNSLRPIIDLVDPLSNGARLDNETSNVYNRARLKGDDLPAG